MLLWIGKATPHTCKSLHHLGNTEKIFLGFKYAIPTNEKTEGVKLLLQKLTAAVLGTSAYIPGYLVHIS